MNKKVILSVTNDLVTDQRLNKVATSLSGAGYEVFLIGRQHRNSPDINTLQHSSKRFKLIFNTGPLFYLEYNLYLLFYLLFVNFDLLLSNDLDTLPANFVASRLKSKPLIYDSHEYFTEVPELVNRPFIKKIWTGIESVILPRIKYSYTVSNSIADIYNNKYRINMKVVRNVPLCIGKFQRSGIQISLPEKKIIIYQGALNLGRGIELVIKAMKYIDNAIFLIIGDGDLKNDLLELTAEHNLGDRVIFKGRVLIDDLKEYTKKAHLGISLEENLGLNYYYALPNKLFDYIQAEVPVIASELPEIEKIVAGNNIGQTISNRNIEFIAGKIKFMLNNEEARAVWKNNLKKIKGKYCWENEERILLEIFKEINT